jgi:hypothetical protein
MASKHLASEYLTKMRMWKLLAALDPDVALLQEAADIPDSVRSSFAIRFRTAITRHGKPQRWFGLLPIFGSTFQEWQSCKGRPEGNCR